jgi:hypothetical protein
MLTTRLTRRVAVAAFAVALLFGGEAQLNADDRGDRLKIWSSLPQGDSGLVFIIDAPVTSFELATGQKKILSFAKWTKNLPFVRQYRLPPGVYSVVLKPPLISATVESKAGFLTYVTLRAASLPSSGQEPVIGLEVSSSRGVVPEFVEQLLEKAYLNGLSDAYTTEALPDLGGERVLLVSTEPPWQIPPPPPPRRQ